MIVVIGLVLGLSYTNISPKSASAQTGGCPETYGPNNPAKWGVGNNVKLILHSAFTDTERQIIKTAFQEWNDHSFLNCSNVTFDTKNVVIADQPPTTPEALTH